VNLGIPGATVQTALAEEVPEALAARPDLVVVLLGVNDLRANTSSDTFQTELTVLLRQLRGSRPTPVLVGNVPPLDHLPAFTRCEPFAPAPDGSCDRSRTLTAQDLDAMVGAYERAVSRAAAATGATVVDLRAPELAARRAGTEASLISGDGFHPSTAGHLLIARTFAAAVRRLGVG
jgi:lysophospholipase L1-like esterase